MSYDPPHAILGYKILRELGRGGMATVYLAIQESLHREVALKLLSPALTQDTQAAERFLREARIEAQLQHRHIVGVYDFGVHEGQPYIAMEHEPGGCVHVAEGQGMPPEAALTIIREVSLALAHAHAHGIIHRDIKPENILQREDGSCALSDFGIARTLIAVTTMSDDCKTIGTPHYMSPEQLQGSELDGRSDLYSLGVVLYQLLTGRLPYQGTDGWAVGMQHISAALPKLPAHLNRYQGLIDALMAKKPEQRPQTGTAVAKIIDSLQVKPASSIATQALNTTTKHQPWRLWLTATVCLLAFALLGWNFMPRNGTTQASQKMAAGSNMTATAERSIAVLPLVNISGDPANEYFSDGLAETTLDMLARVPDLKVIARTSSFAFKDKAIDVREIGKKLNVAHLLEGSVQQSGDKLRITVQLIRTSDGVHLWSQIYDRQMADVFKIQDEVAAGVVKALQGALPASAQAHLLRKRTNDVAAYQAYLRGMALLPNRNIREMRLAAKYFERAIEIDPSYAKAYAAAAICYGLLKTHASISDEEMQRRSRYVERALELAPDLGEAHIARGAILDHAGDVAGAERAYKRGIELAPSYASGYQWYAGLLLYVLGQPEKALPLYEHAIALDPLSPNLREQYAYALAGQGQIDAAFAISEKLLTEHPSFAKAYWLRASLLIQRGDLAGALRVRDKAIALDPGADADKIDLCYSLLEFGALPEAKTCANNISSNQVQTDRQRLLEAEIKALEGDFVKSLSLIDSMENPAPWQRARMLYLNGRTAEALSIYQRVAPEMFKQPLNNTPVPYPTITVVVAASQLKAGDKAAAEKLLRYGLRMSATRPRSGQFGRNWADVYAYTLLGELSQACAALKDADSQGYFLNYRALEIDPRLAPLRAKPCFEQHMAAIRAKATAQVQLARAAGVL